MSNDSKNSASDKHDDSHLSEEDAVSKSQLKREMLALQGLGEALVGLPDRELATIPVPEQLLEHINLAQKITHHGGKKRQLQYIGKLMRKLDVSEIQIAYKELLNGRKTHAREFHQLEQWRDKLIEQGSTAIEELLAQYPDADRQQLRQMVRQAQKEQSQEKPPATSRKLFRYIKTLAEQ